MLRIVVLLPFLEIAATIENNINYDPTWSYDNEYKWPGRRCQQGGHKQSPININTSNAIPDIAQKFIKYGPLQFKGYQKVLVSGINNGHTIQFSTEGHESIHPVLSGGPLKHEYRLEQMHYHWLSEHSVDGIKYPLEFHFVHVRNDLSVNEALSRKDGLAIVAVFGNLQPEFDDNQPDTSEIIEYLPKLQNTGDRMSGLLLDMTKLLSANRNTYYTYSGSLTSPNCNEAVIWIIFAEPIYLTDAQYHVFSDVAQGRYNFRSLQKLDRHVVYMTGEPKLNVPKLVVYFEQFIHRLRTFFTKLGLAMSSGMKSR